MRRRARSPEHQVFALVAGGGTAGHVTPAVAIGRALVRSGHPAASIHFVGSQRGIERRLVPEAGFGITLLPGRGIVRRLSWANVRAIVELAIAAVRATWLVARLRPAVVVVVGGYASVASAVGAVLMRVPIVVAEQNATPGLANRLAGRFAAACAVSFPETPLPRAVLTGNPVRPEILEVDRSSLGQKAAREALRLPTDRKIVAVAGGSLGARRINHAMSGLLDAWWDRTDVAVRHVVGTREGAAEETPQPPGSGALVYQQVAFEERMDLLLAACDVAVQRAGASTVAELVAAGVPSVLVPLPGAPGDHQTKNAERLAEAGAAVMVPDSELDSGRLVHELDGLLADPSKLETMSAAARALARPDAAAAVAALAEAHARA